MTKRLSVVTGLLIVAFVTIWFGIGRTRESLAPGSILCGQVCAYRISSLRGAPVEAAQVISEMPPTNGTHSLQDIAAFLNKQQIPTEGLRLTIDELNDNSFPCVAALSHPAHFVVLIQKQLSTIHLFEADGHRSVVSIDDLRKRWGNVILVAKERRIPAVDERKSPPSIRVDALYKDIGWISSVSHPRNVEFKLQNIGKETLLISDVMKSCKCLESSLDSARLNGGEATVLRLTYSPDAKTGWFEQSVVITSNDPMNPVLELTTAGIAAHGLVIQPERIRFNADPKTGKIQPQYLFLAHPDHYTSFHLSALKATDDRFTVREVAWDHAEMQEWYSRLGTKSQLPVASASERKFRVVKVSLKDQTSVANGETSALEIETDVDHFRQLRIPVSTDNVNLVKAFPPIITFNSSGTTDATPPLLTATVRFRGPLEDCRVASVTEEADSPASFAVRSQTREKNGLLRVEFEISTDDAVEFNRSSVKLEFGSEGNVTVLALQVLHVPESLPNSNFILPSAMP
ncbi:MAG: DUF1573 domain-containing protein [Planctomycetota bacterium]